MKADFPWVLLAVVVMWAAFSLAKPQPGDRPLTAECREARDSATEEPDVPVQLCPEDAEVARFAESIAPDLLLEFEVDGWRRSS